MKNSIKKLLNFCAVILLAATYGCDANDDATNEVSVTKVFPEIQYMADPATLEGSGLDQVKYVFVGNFDAPFTYSEGIITFIVPASATPGTNKITLVMNDNYRVTSTIDVMIKPIPTVTTITPSAAAAGENVTLYGTNLNNSATVKVGGVNATVVSATATKLVFTVPTVSNNTRSAAVVVTTTFGTASPASIFYASKNLILNSELEVGVGDVFDSWSKFNGATFLVATSVKDESYYGRALKATGDGRAPWRTQFVSSFAPTVVGRKYLVFMWIRSTAANGSIRFSTDPSPIYGNDITIGTDWRQVTFEFTANAALTRIALDMGSKTNVYFVDNVTMVAL